MSEVPATPESNEPTGEAVLAEILACAPHCWFPSEFGGDRDAIQKPLWELCRAGEIEVADWGTVDARIGLGYNVGAHNTRLALTGGRFWLDDLKTRNSGGVSLDYRYLASKQDQVTFGISASRNKFLPDGLKINSYDNFQGAFGWLHGAADGRGAAGVTLIAGVEKELNGRVEGDKPFAGIRVTLQRALSDSVGGFLLAGAQNGRYSEANPLFGAKREDTLYDVVTGLSWAFAKGWSLRPQVLYMKNRSNLPLFEYDRTDVSLNLRLDV